MERWSLSNYFRQVSHKQFVDYTTKLKLVSEAAFRSECEVDIHLKDRTKVYTTFYDPALQDIVDRENEGGTVIKTGNIDDVTKEHWNAAAYAEVTVRPVDKDQAPDYAFAHAEFKGRLPRQATFYIQGGENTHNAKLSFLVNMSGRIGDGYESNGQRSNAVPSSLWGIGL